VLEFARGVLFFECGGGKREKAKKQVRKCSNKVAAKRCFGGVWGVNIGAVFAFSL
jgi:hypothetical protein